MAKRRKPRDYVGEHFKLYPTGGTENRPAITCRDGMVYSVQASRYHYCSPREDAAEWTSFEVWGVKRNGHHTTANPEGWVPRDVINKRIRRHGGVKRVNEVELLLPPVQVHRRLTHGKTEGHRLPNRRAVRRD